MSLLKRTTPLVVLAVLLGTAGCSPYSNDAAITTRVKAAIAQEPGLKGTTVTISTDQKVVRLSGTVKSRAERAMLVSVARGVEGVQDVKTDLVVQAAQPKTAAKPQQKPVVEARAKEVAPAKQEAPAPHYVAQREQLQDTGR